MKSFSQLSDMEILSVLEYFKLIKWGRNPFVSFSKDEHPYAVCMTYAFNDKGQVYDMDSKNRDTIMGANLPNIPGVDLVVDRDTKRLELFIIENGEIQWS